MTPERVKKIANWLVKDGWLTSNFMTTAIDTLLERWSEMTDVM